MIPEREAELAAYGERIRACGRRVVAECLETGRLLNAARALVGEERDGRWRQFLQNDCGGIGYMQALRFMRVAERYGDRPVIHVDNTPFRVLAELAAPENDPAMVESIEARIARGEPLSVRDVIDAREHWRGMPEYEQEDQSPFRTIHVHFTNEQEVAAFFDLMGREASRRSWLWFTPQPECSAADRVWVDAHQSEDKAETQQLEMAEAA